MIRLFEKLIEAISWIKIALSPTIIGFFVGLIAYNNLSSPLNLIVGLGLLLLGVVLGVIWAIRVSRKGSPTTFISRVNASPDLDNINKPS